MADPVGWLDPFTSWAPDTVINTTVLNRIENNIALLKGRVWGKDGTFDARVNSPFFSSAVVKTIKYSVINKTVFLDIPADFASPLYTANDELQLEPVTSWPSDIIPAVATRAHCVFKNNGNDSTHFERPGYMLIPISTSSNIICYITSKETLGYGDGYFIADYFHESGGASLKKEIPRQTIMYMLEDAP